jgi:uncharacterized protein (TIGR02001 family)
MKVKNALLLSVMAFSGAAFAQAAAPAPDYTLSFNVGAVTDYRYRGISQSRLKPALQGGVDFSHKSGFYVGTWLSTIKWLKDVPGGKGPVEWDIYGGYKGSITEALGFDVGVLRYQYPRENFTVSPNTTEVYGALSFGPATLKYSHSTTTLFGFADSKGSGYLDLSATFDLGQGWSIVPHIGHQKVDGNGNGIFSYTDISVGVNKDFGNGLVASLTAVDTNIKKVGGVPVYVSPSGKSLGKAGLVAGIKYSF